MVGERSGFWIQENYYRVSGIKYPEYSMKTDLKVKDVVARPGTIEYGSLEAGEMQDGGRVLV